MLELHVSRSDYSRFSPLIARAVIFLFLRVKQSFYYVKFGDVRIFVRISNLSNRDKSAAREFAISKNKFVSRKAVYASSYSPTKFFARIVACVAAKIKLACK